MTSAFNELDESFGIGEYLLYDTKSNLIKINTFSDSFSEQKLKQFITTYLSKNQQNMDLEESFNIYYGIENVFAIFRHQNFIFCCLTYRDSDLEFLCTKMDEIWIRFSLGM